MLFIIVLELLKKIVSYVVFPNFNILDTNPQMFFWEKFGTKQLPPLGRVFERKRPEFYGTSRATARPMDSGCLKMSKTMK